MERTGFQAQEIMGVGGGQTLSKGAPSREHARGYMIARRGGAMVHIATFYQPFIDKESEEKKRGLHKTSVKLLLLPKKTFFLDREKTCRLLET